MRADKIHRAGRRGILSNGERDRGSLSSFFSFRLVSLVSSFAKEETREMRQRKSKRKWILKNNIVFWNSTFLLFIYNEKEIEKIVDMKLVQTSRNAFSFRLLLRKIHLPPGGRLTTGEANPSPTGCFEPVYPSIIYVRKKYRKISIFLKKLLQN